MPQFVVERVVEAVDRNARKPFTGARILILGIAYEKNVNNTRKSPALKLIELIEARGATVDYHDPHVPVLPPAERHGMSAMQSVPLDPERISGYDAVLIVTDHDAVDYAAVVRHAKLVVDTRNACHKHGFVGESIVTA
jgi:UDP-N-acetyl-D-glucosamine dehydrogenase